MTLATPPRAATWLLMQLASGPQRSALVGDLQEQFHRGRSTGWYWSQVLAAIAVGAVHDGKHHLVVVGRAVALWFVLSYAAMYLTFFLHHFFGLIVWNWTVQHDLDMLRVLWFGRPVASVVRLSRPSAASIQPSSGGRWFGFTTDMRRRFSWRVW
jgi:hypothetical protein